MRDGAAERRVGSGPCRIDVDPLAVLGRFGEQVDALLRHQEPVADRDLASDLPPQLFQIRDLDLRHVPASGGRGARPAVVVRLYNTLRAAGRARADLVPRGADLPLACAEAAIGNKLEYGKMVVSGRELRVRCDCSSHVDLWIELPEGGAWLTRGALREVGELAARKHGVTVAW